MTGTAGSRPGESTAASETPDVATAPKPSRAARAVPVLLATAAYVVLSFFWLLPASKTPRTMIADLGDPLHLAYILAWDAHQFVNSPSQLFETNSFYPAKQSLAFSEHLIPEAIMVAPVFWLTGNAILTYNVCVMLGLVSSALAMFFLIRQLTGSDGAAFLAGIAYSFTGFSLMEIARVQVIHMQWWPLALFFLGRFLETSRFKDALGFGLRLALQGLSCSYYLLFSALIAPFWLVSLYVVHRRLPSVHELTRLAAAAVISGAVVFAVIHPYLGRVGDDTDSTVSAGVDLQLFLTPGQANPLFGDAAAIDEPVATYAREYIGASTGFLAALGLILGRRKLNARNVRAFVWLAFFTLMVGMLLAMGKRVHVWGHDIGRGPLDVILQVFTLGTRHVPRFVALTKLGLAVLVGIGAAEAGKRLSPFLRRAALICAALALPLEHWQPVQAIYGWSIPADETVPPVYRALGEMGTGPVIEVPLPSKKRLWALHQYFSTFHWRPIPFGRTRYYPPWLDYLTEGLLDFPDERSLDALDVMGVDTVLVQPYMWAPKERAERMAAVEASPRLRLIKAFPNDSPGFPELREGRVYSLTRTSFPPPCRLEGELSRDKWQASSKVGTGAEEVLTDKLNTFWTTGRLQQEGDSIRVAFDKPALIAAVSMQTGFRPADFPNHYMVEVRTVDGEWNRVIPIGVAAEERRTLLALVNDPVNAEHVVRFDPQVVTGFRLTLTWAGAYPTPWTVVTLRAYEGCAAPPAGIKQP